MNYFEHFSIDVSFTPDLEDLRKRYLKISRENHPDFSAGDDQAYEQALIVTSLNNQAYKALTDFDERIKYVLELRGCAISSDDKLDPSFLMDMMEWNEEIMETGMSEDSDKMESLSTRFSKMEEDFKGRLTEGLERFEKEGDEKELTGIKEIYLQRKYLLRLRNSIDKFARL